MNKRSKVFLILIIDFYYNIDNSNQSFTEREHRTSGATENLIQLWCYKCQSDIHGDHCIHLNENNTNLIEKCPKNNHLCLVKRTSMTENFTLSQKLWNLERKCSNKKCEPGCLIIGERTKLHSCTSCCNESLCNTNNRIENLQPIFYLHILFQSLSFYAYNHLKKLYN